MAAVLPSAHARCACAEREIRRDVKEAGQASVCTRGFRCDEKEQFDVGAVVVDCDIGQRCVVVPP